MEMSAGLARARVGARIALRQTKVRTKRQTKRLAVCLPLAASFFLLPYASLSREGCSSKAVLMHSNLPFSALYSALVTVTSSLAISNTVTLPG